MDKPLVILFITYARTAYAIRTIDSIFKHLKTPAGLSWYICDDGSDPAHHTAVMTRIQENGGHVCGHHNEKLGYGGGVNKGWPICSQTGPITLWVEDDWELEQDWDMSPYIELLEGDPAVGMIRLGHLPIGQKGEAIGERGKMYLRIDQSIPYGYSGNPHLKHDRFMLHYGKLPEGTHPGETETGYDRIVNERQKGGPSILWPLYIADRHIWGHIGTIQSYDKGGRS